MKYFTRGWANGEFSDAEEDRIRDAYSQRIRQISPQLASPVSRLANEINLHDALIAQVRVSVARQELTLRFVCCDDQGGCRNVELQYSGVQMGFRMLQTLKDRARDRESSILYDEVDIDDDGGLVHRLLFSPDGEIAIWFREISIKTSPRPGIEIRLIPYFVEED